MRYNIIQYTIILVLMGLVIWGTVDKRKRIHARKSEQIILINNHTEIPLVPFTWDILDLMDVKDVRVTFFYMYYEELTPRRLAGLIKPNLYNKKSYVIFLSKYLGGENYARVISHELVHLHQIKNKDLVLLNENIVIWKGDSIDLRTVPYHHRKYEIDAYERSVLLIKELKKLDSLKQLN